MRFYSTVDVWSSASSATIRILRVRFQDVDLETDVENLNSCEYPAMRKKTEGILGYGGAQLPFVFKTAEDLG